MTKFFSLASSRAIRTCGLLFFFLLITFPGFAQQDEYHSPVFDLSVATSIRDTGNINADQQRTGQWVIHGVDSDAFVNMVNMMHDLGNPSPPVNVVMFRYTANFNAGALDGMLHLFISYDTRSPIRWTLIETIEYENGVMNGKNKMLYANGRVMRELNYINGKADGTCTTYYPDGTVMSTVVNNNDILNGPSKSYNRNGQLVYSTMYKNGKLNGTATSYYSNGQKKDETEYKDDQLVSVSGAWDREGKPLTAGTLANGTGTVYTYNELGGLSSIATYENSTLNGLYKEYYTSGELHYKRQYKNGKADAQDETYYRNGKMAKQVIRDNGKAVKALLYYPNGQSSVTYYYNNSEMLWNAFACKDTAGKPLDAGTFKEGNGILRTYNDSGQLYNQAMYKNGSRNGIYIQYYSNGKINYKSEFKDGKLNGIRKYYSDKGPLISVVEYKNDLCDGIYKTYYDNGQLKWKAYYWKGRLWETIESFDRNGKRLDAGTLRDGNGVAKYYTEDGVLNWKQEYQYGLEYGMNRRYWPSGKIRSEVPHENGKTEGIKRNFRKSGKLEGTYEYHNDEQNGEEILYHENGELWTKRIYVSGKLYRIVTIKDAQGNPVDKGTYFHGSGTMKIYNEDGEVTQVRHYDKWTCEDCDE